MGLKHSYHSLKTDPADPTIIGATKWNADHYYVDNAGAPIGNVGALLLAGAAGALTHLDSVAAGSVLTSAGAGVPPVWAASSGPAPGSPLQVDRLGVGVAPAAGTGTLTLAAAGVVAWDTRSTIRSASDGTLMLANAAGTDFSLLRFGGTTNAFPAFRRQGAAIGLVTADVSLYGNLLVGSLQVGQAGTSLITSGAGSPEGAVSASIGSLYLNTSGGLATTLYIKTSGAGTATGWTAK